MSTWGLAGEAKIVRCDCLLSEQSQIANVLSTTRPPRRAGNLTPGSASGPLRAGIAEARRESARRAGSLGKASAGNEDLMLSLEADTDALSGHLDRAREFSQRATETAKRDHLPEQAANWQAEAALREAFVGNTASAKRAALAALAIATPLSGAGRTRVDLVERAREDIVCPRVF